MSFASDTQERDSFYLGALLHDIGKFIERAKRQDFQDLAREYHQRGEASKNYAHKRYSAAFIRKNQESSPLIHDTAPESYALWHHRGNEPDKQDFTPFHTKGTLMKLIRIADDCASAERREDANLDPQTYYLTKLQSIFTDIRLQRDDGMIHSAPEIHYLGLEPLSTKASSCFPLSSAPAFEDTAKLPYSEPVDGFLKSFEAIRNDEELLYVLQKYLYSVPAQTPTEFNGKKHLSRPDISLFQHLKATAAIALCLYDEYREGGWKGKEKEIADDSGIEGYLSERFPAPCMLVVGDLSGIQDFIFNIPSKKAAKSLKGRSLFIQLVIETCVRHVLDALRLKSANLLFNGGGKFYLLAPAVRKKELEECKIRIADALLESGLSLVLADVPVSIADFRGYRTHNDRIVSFASKWAEAEADVDNEKKRRYSCLEADRVFSPRAQVYKTGENDPYAVLTDCFNKANAYTIRKKTGENGNAWQKAIHALGYEIDFSHANKDAIVFNNTDFEGKNGGFRFMAKAVPEWSESDARQFRNDLEKTSRSIEHYEDENSVIAPGHIKTFSQLAGMAYLTSGTEQIGVLKMDVDNLGRIFSEGLPDHLKTISRMMTLSGSLQWFFDGYVNELMNEEPFAGRLYLIFSGGDDFFLVGSWNRVFDFALSIKDAFTTFTRNPAITLSASLMVVDGHYPVSRFARRAEEELHKAKYDSLDKNSISIFGEILSWKEFEKACQLKENLCELVNASGGSRAIIRKVMNGCDGLKLLHARAARFYAAMKNNDTDALRFLNAELPDGFNVWRMSYFLRDIKGDRQKAIVASIISEYESVVFNAMNGKPGNPMYIMAGARWAELATRKKLTYESTNQGQ